jgi:hypothetical protein
MDSRLRVLSSKYLLLDTLRWGEAFWYVFISYAATTQTPLTSHLPDGTVQEV